MSKSYPVIERTDGRLVVLARSAEEAHLAATEELGVSCVVVSVERVRSGGLGGFFSTELVRLVATSRHTATSPRDDDDRTSSFASAEDLLSALPSSGQFADRLKDELSQLRSRGAAAADDVMAPARPVLEPRRVLAPAAAALPTAPEPPRPVTLRSLASAADPLAAIPVRMAPEDPAIAAIPVRFGTESLPVERPAELPVELPIELPIEMPAARIEVDPEPLDTGLDELEWGDAGVDADSHQLELAPAVASALAARSGFSPLETFDQLGTDALLAQMVAAEVEFEERPTTRRAEMIRRGAALPNDPAPVEPAPEFLGAEPTPEVTVQLEVTVEPVVTAEPELAMEPEAAVEPEAEVEPEAAVLPDMTLESAIEPAIEPTALPEFPMVAAEPEPEPTPVPPVPSWDDWSRWSAPMLRAYGVPDTIVQRVARYEPSDDTEWIVAFMTSVRHLCSGLPAKHMIVAGPSCANLARQLALPSQPGDELALSNGSVASPHVSAGVLQRQPGERSVHVVVGGAWHHLVPVRPDVVSAATEHDLLEALRVAEAWGAQLGWTLVGDAYVRIDPYLLAGRIRALLPEPAAPTTGGDLMAPFV